MYTYIYIYIYWHIIFHVSCSIYHIHIYICWHIIFHISYSIETLRTIHSLENGKYLILLKKKIIIKENKKEPNRSKKHTEKTKQSRKTKKKQKTNKQQFNLGCSGGSVFFVYICFLFFYLFSFLGKIYKKRNKQKTIPRAPGAP